MVVMMSGLLLGRRLVLQCGEGHYSYLQIFSQAKWQAPSCQCHQYQVPGKPAPPELLSSWQQSANAQPPSLAQTIQLRRRPPEEVPGLESLQPCISAGGPAPLFHVVL